MENFKKLVKQYMQGKLRRVGQTHPKVIYIDEVSIGRKFESRLPMTVILKNKKKIE
jgi:hypothetical protein